MGAELARFLARVEPFSVLGGDALAQMAAVCKRRRIPAGRTLFRRGDDDRDISIVLRGAFEVLVAGGPEGDRVVARLGPRDVVGEISVVAGGRRTATVRATRAAKVATIPAATFRDLLDEHPALARRFGEQAHQRLLQSQLPELVASVFGTTDGDLVAAIDDAGEWVHLRAGEALFEQDEPADAAYLIVFGRVALGVRHDEPGTPAEPGSPARFEDASRGELIGTRALLDKGVRSASAWAVRDTYALRIPRPAFERLAESFPEAMLTLTRTQLARVQAPSRRVPSAERVSVALVAASRAIDLRMFASSLVEELSRHDKTGHVWSGRVDAMLRRPGIAQSEDGPSHVTVTRRLYEVEERHRVLVYEADTEWTPWTRRAVRSADWILVIAEPGDEPAEIERRLYEWLPPDRRPRVSLVLMRTGSAPPSNTAASLARRPVDDHYHVRNGNDADLRRLARMVAGRAVAVVLGGGGARGFAHIGVLRALSESGIPVDIVAGSSIGAIMATGPAAEISQRDYLEVAVKRFEKLLDYTLPLVSILKGKRISRSIESQFGDLGIEDLWLPYFCITTNLTTITADVHRRGRLATALRASAAIPGVLPPVVIGGDVHTDGGVLNNLPADVMRALYPRSTIIAVDVAPPAGPPARVDPGLWVSGWTALWHKVRRNRSWRVPGITDVLVRATVAASTRDRNRMVADGVPDLYLPLDMRGVSALEFDVVAPVAERGYEASKPLIEKWLADHGAAYGLPLEES